MSECVEEETTTELVIALLGKVYEAKQLEFKVAKYKCLYLIALLVEVVGSIVC